MKFLQFLNNLHPNLRFTHELGPDRLPFLDTEISLPTTENSTLSSKVYRKSTNTNVILNYSALCPQNWKSGLVTCFLNRAYTVCSSWNLFDNEVNLMRDIFKKNAYPTDFFDNNLNKFLNNKIVPDEAEEPETEENTFMIIIPYIGHASVIFKSKIRKLFRSLNINMKVVFKSYKVGQYFSLKDPTPLALKASVIYEFKASCDGCV